MGVKDLHKLFPIYEQTKSLSKKLGLDYNFKLDSGHFETALEIFPDGRVNHPPRISRTPYTETGEIWCPDLLDFHNKIIIEYEEEAKPNKGAKRRKGHFECNTRDKARDEAYSRAGFTLLKIWESDKEWKDTLIEFLLFHNRKS